MALLIFVSYEEEITHELNQHSKRYKRMSKRLAHDD